MTLPESKVAGFVLLPELKITHFGTDGLWLCEKQSELEVCPRCATPSRSVYDHRWVRVRDSPVRGLAITLKILKRRFFCKTCGKPFTEPVPGVLPSRRTTQRFRSDVMQACEKYTDLSRVRREFKVSSHFVYDAYYERLRLRMREREGAAWPSMIGIDEHAYGKDKLHRRTQFVTTIVNHGKGRMFEAVIGKTQAELETATAHIPGRENVLWATIDMCDPYRNYIRSFFPNAKIVADKFHVLRLLTPALLRKRKEITGTRADLRAKKLLLMSAKDLSYGERLALDRFLSRYPEMKELYDWKERLHTFYRMRGGGRSYQAYKKLVDDMSVSFLPEIRTLRKTLLKWKDEILNYFYCRLTNARLEGFNCKASAMKRRAYGYRNPENYRIQLLHACS
jgi:transposase